MRHTRLLLTAALLAAAACSGEGDDKDAGLPPAGEVCEPELDRICPFAGAGQAGYNGEDTPVHETWMYFPMDIVISPYGKPVYADWNNHKLRMLEDDGTVRTIMGTDFIGDGDDELLDLSLLGADGLDVNLNHPTQQRYFSDGTLLSASWHTHKLRTWDPETGKVHVLVGKSADFVGDNYEDAGTARFNQPVSVELDSNEDLYVVDMRNERIRHLRMSDFTITTLIGNGAKDYCGDGGPGRDACLGFPRNDNPEPGGAIAFSNDESKFYFADTENQVIRVYDVATGYVDLYAGGPMEPGDVDGDRLTARFATPRDLVMSPEGLLYVADSDNHKIRVIDTNTGEVSTFAGTGEPSCPGDGPETLPRTCDGQLTGTSGDGGHRLDATLYRPFGVELDLDGNLVVADTFSHRFRIIYR